MSTCTGVQPDSHAPGLAAHGYVNRILAHLTCTPAPTSDVVAAPVRSAEIDARLVRGAMQGYVYYEEYIILI